MPENIVEILKIFALFISLIKFDVGVYDKKFPRANYIFLYVGSYLYYDINFSK